MDAIEGPAVRRRWRLRLWLPLVVVFMLALFNGPIISGVLRGVCAWAAASHGMEFRAGSLRCAVGSPLVAGDVVLGFAGEGGLRPVVLVEAMEIDWRPPWQWFGRRSGGIVGDVRLRGVECLLDTRSATTPVAEERQRNLDAIFAVLAMPALAGRPGSFLVEDAQLEITGDGSRVVARGVGFHFTEDGAGYFRVGSLGLKGWGIDRGFGPLEAVTSLDGGAAVIAGMGIAPGVRITEASVSGGLDGAVAVSVRGDVFGGSVRGDMRFGGVGGRSHRDVALFASDVPLRGIPELIGIRVDAEGSLAEGRLTFRGDAGRPADAEASLRVVANGVRWNSVRWDSLELGASLIHRRLMVRDLDLRQGGNTVKANGEISLAEGWSKIVGAPFLLNLRAKLPEPSLFGGLLGLPPGETTGWVGIEGSVSGRDGEMDGFVGVRGRDIVHRGVPLDRVAIEVVFKQSKAEVEKFEIASGGSELGCGGEVLLADPHRYRFDLRASIDDVSRFLPLFPVGGLPVSSGALELEWSGEGDADAHSGGFEARLGGLVSRFTPAGLTGRFAGTYSPENLYFSGIEVQSESLRLSSRATFAPVGGVRFDDLLVESGGKPVLKATAYFPVNPFAVAAGGEWIPEDGKADNLYIRASMPNGIRISNLSRLAGQELGFDGVLSFDLEAYGPFAAIDGRASLTCRDLVVAGVRSKELVFDFRALEGRASATGTLTPERGKDLELRAEFPFGPAREPGGGIRWIAREGAVEAEAVVPRIDLVLLRPLLPAFRGLRGGMRGRLAVDGTAGSPLVSGEAVIEGGAFSFGGLPSPLVDAGGRLIFEGGRVLLEGMEASCGDGRVRVSGGVDFGSEGGIEHDLAIVGTGVPVIDDGRVVLGGSLALHARGGRDGGRLSGTVELVDSRIDAEPVIEGGDRARGGGGRFLPGPLADLCASGVWDYDVRIGGGEAIALGTGALAGTMRVDLRLGGTRDSPSLAGMVVLRDVRVVSPWGPVEVGEGIVLFPGGGFGDAFVMLEDPRAGATLGWFGGDVWFCSPGGEGSTDGFVLGMRPGSGVEWTAADQVWRLR